MPGEERASAVDVARGYADVQARLVAATRLAHPTVGRNLLGIDRTGTLATDGEAWTFTHHGAGLRYVGMHSGRVVDAHVLAFEHPRALDAWRLEQYLESMSITEVWLEDERFPMDDDGCAERLIAAMTARGLLVRLPGRHALFQPA
jgi:hypothetical protein